MNARRVLALSISLAISLGAGAASAQQDDDLLSPLPAVEKAPRTSNNRKKRKAAPRQSEGSDELVAPLASTDGASLSVNLATPGKGARLFIDATEIGPLAPGSTAQPLAPGKHKVIVRRPGFKDFSRIVSIRAGAVAQLLVSLEPVAGVLAVQSDVPRADVWVDGAKLGQTPLKDVELPPGSHEVRVSRAGYVPSVTQLSVRLGSAYEVRAQLKPLAPAEVAQTDRPEQAHLTPSEALAPAPGPLDETAPPAAVEAGPPWYGRWYVWAGAGAIVAATAVGVALAAQPRPLDPGQVCHGVCNAVINPPHPAAAALRF
jgi:hypothetical protein